MGLMTSIPLPARNRPIPAWTAYSLCCITGSIRTIAASPHESLLAIDSLLYSLLYCLLDSLDDRLLERAEL